MSANLLTEKLISISQAARLIPGYRRTARTAHPSCVFRWMRDGVRLPTGELLRLEGFRLAGRWLTSREALARFVDRQNAGRESASAPPAIRTPTRRQRAADRAARKLEKLGI
jgi:hypothetical protein